ncbi:MAG: ABC transporter permease [Desulfobulbaceae bacterium]|jgi:putative ABC transport system permease protein|nr:ABC transporter permease [Desulfobulbaceae bacterium]HKJ13398.1 ABC transporter permease [Desulfobulbales bacterium]MDH3541042.1 ABC transporter permease [Desulfobulbaceae bacterium]MDH3781364.1 ABC transporter permease [Desulfobulbaceae bacterium]MDH3865637.1 ABC transporter permease [Desulfobulbaceae bacterium]
MHIQDFIQLTTNAVRSQRMRSFLTALGIAVGIGSVVLLTSLGEGLHRFMLAEFTQFGTNLIGVNPGRVTTHGVSGALISNVRPLSIEDGQALKKIPQVVDVVAVVQGNAAVKVGKKQRRTTVYGIDPAAPEVFKLQMATGTFLPDDPPRAARSFAVLGSKVKDELFGTGQVLGKWIRIGSERFRVIGSMESKGQMLGFDLDDAVWIPTAKALAMFNRESLMEIDVLYKEGSSAEDVSDQIKKILIARHGTEDFTITTQEKMLEVLGKILNILTLAVGGLGGISLLVGGVGILTIMTIAVNERTNEIGLLRALGSEKNQILGIFLGEAVILASMGGLAGLVLGVGGAWLLGFLVPALPTHISWTYIIAAELLAAGIGLLAGVLPARRAAALKPVDALRSE